METLKLGKSDIVVVKFNDKYLNSGSYTGHMNLGDIGEIEYRYGDRVMLRGDSDFLLATDVSLVLTKGEVRDLPMLKDMHNIDYESHLICIKTLSPVLSQFTIYNYGALDIDEIDIKRSVFAELPESFRSHIKSLNDLILEDGMRYRCIRQGSERVFTEGAYYKAEICSAISELPILTDDHGVFISKGDALFVEDLKEPEDVTIFGQLSVLERLRLLTQIEKGYTIEVWQPSEGGWSTVNFNYEHIILENNKFYRVKPTMKEVIMERINNMLPFRLTS